MKFSRLAEKITESSYRLKFFMIERKENIFTTATNREVSLCKRVYWNKLYEMI